MLSSTFAMGIEPITLIYVGLANRHGHFRQVGGTIGSVLFEYLQLFYCIFSCYGFRMMCYE